MKLTTCRAIISNFESYEKKIGKRSVFNREIKMENENNLHLCGYYLDRF